MDDTSTDQMSTAASVEQLNSLLNRIQKIDSGTAPYKQFTVFSRLPLSVLPSIEGEY